MAPGHLLLDVPEIHQLLELPLELGAVVGVHVGRHPQGLEDLLHARRGARETVLQPLYALNFNMSEYMSDEHVLP